MALTVLRLRHSGRRLPAGALVAAAAVLVTVDLFRANMGYNPAIPISHATVPATGSIRYLQSQRPSASWALAPARHPSRFPPV